MNTIQLAQFISAEIAAQTEIDDLGDAESICFMARLPTVNMVQLAEALIAKGIIK